MSLNLPGDKEAMLLGGRGRGAREDVVFIKQPRTASVIVALDGTGDTDSIQEGINLIPKRGGVVFIKEGTYLTDKAITISKDDVIIQGTNGTSINSDGAFNTIEVSAATSVLIRDMVIEGDTGEVANNGVYVNGTADFKMINCFLSGFGKHGVFLDKCTNAKIMNSVVIDCQDDNLHMAGGTRNLVLGCGFEIAVDNGIEISGTVGDPGTKNIISNCFFNSNDWGIEITTNVSDTLLIGNVFNNNTVGQVDDNGANTLPNGATGTTNLQLDDLNIMG